LKTLRRILRDDSVSWRIATTWKPSIDLDFRSPAATYTKTTSDHNLPMSY
jgi:hypothetical protein